MCGVEAKKEGKAKFRSLTFRNVSEDVTKASTPIGEQQFLDLLISR
jgi:hypothetical protein